MRRQRKMFYQLFTKGLGMQFFLTNGVLGKEFS